MVMVLTLAPPYQYIMFILGSQVGGFHLLNRSIIIRSTGLGLNGADCLPVFSVKRFGVAWVQRRVGYECGPALILLQGGEAPVLAP
jgi:hypothetical protein